jgi:hypothetical protein
MSKNRKTTTKIVVVIAVKIDEISKKTIDERNGV